MTTVTARNRTHLPPREPGVTVDLDRACFDKLILKIDRVPFDATFTRFQQARSFMAGLKLERGRGVSAVKARSADLLFKADVFPAESDGVHTSLNLTLHLNLTRFLARNYARLGTPDDLSSLTQAQRLSWLTRETETAAERSLDNNDNFISDTQARSGARIVQAAWLGPYVQLVLSFLAGELEAALARVPSHEPQPSLLRERPPLLIPLRNWRMLQLEVFWEFWSPNAVAEVSDLVEVAETISYEYDTTRYDLGRFADGFTFGISAKSQVAGVRHKAYAKLLNRLRYELAYDRITTQVEGDLPLSPQPDEYDFEAYASGIIQAAALRANHWWASVSAAEQRSSATLKWSMIAAFFSAIYRSAPPGTAELIVAYLVARGAVPRAHVFPELLTAIQSLRRRGYLVASNPGRARHTTTYRPAPPWDRLIQTLRELGPPASTSNEVGRLDP